LQQVWAWPSFGYLFKFASSAAPHNRQSLKILVLNSRLQTSAVLENMLLQFFITVHLISVVDPDSESGSVHGSGSSISSESGLFTFFYFVSHFFPLYPDPILIQIHTTLPLIMFLFRSRKLTDSFLIWQLSQKVRMYLLTCYLECRIQSAM
jgi:hypothetical protein